MTKLTATLLATLTLSLAACSGSDNAGDQASGANKAFLEACKQGGMKQTQCDCLVDAYTAADVDISKMIDPQAALAEAQKFDVNTAQQVASCVTK